MKIPSTPLDYQRVISAPNPPAPKSSQALGHNSPVSADSLLLSPVAESIRIGQEALQTKIGQQVSAAFEKIGVDLNEAVGIDYSPEAVSDRITDFAGTLFQMYREDRPELTDDEAVDRFQELFVGGVESGYGEAMDLLEGMNMPEEVLDVSRQTKSLIDEKLTELFDSYREAKQAKDEKYTEA